MLIIGSHAAIFNKIHNGEEPRDTDVIGTFAELQSLIKEMKKDALRETHAAGIGLQICAPIDASHWHIRDHNGWNYEFEIAWPGSSGELLLKLEGNEEGREGFASKEACLALKLSHRFKKDSLHHWKTVDDILSYRKQGITLTPELEAWLPQREAETYAYAHPKLNVNKTDFFSGDGVRYVYDHDDLHRIMAVESSPAYTKYMADGEQVLTSKDKFFSLDERTKLLGGLEEALVLCAERSLIPYNFEPNEDEMFKHALMKISTSITSGYFREFCWENQYKILEMYKEIGKDWLSRLKMEIENASIKPHGF